MKDKTRKEIIWASQEKNKKNSLSLTIVLIKLIGYFLFFIGNALKPFVTIRIGLLYHRAMGRFYGNTEYFLRLRKLHPPKTKEFTILVSGTPVNHQVLSMIARQIKVINNDLLWKILDILRKMTTEHQIWVDLGCTGWLRGREWSEPGPQLSFTETEHKRGQALMRKLGVPEGVSHVCIFAKDRFYADSPDTVLDPHSYWGSRDFRNCDIMTYLPAAEYLAKQGIYVFRMGIHKPEKLLPRNINPKIIDYTGIIRPTLEDPDFAETYLQATCKFFLGCTSGIYLLSSMFGVPVAYANMIPYGECGRMSHDIIIFKKTRNKNNGNFISFREMIKRGVDSDWLTIEEIGKLEAEGSILLTIRKVKYWILR